MTTKLFIGNLPFSMTDKALKELFSQAGNVTSANIVKNKFSGRSRGFGFVEMETEEEAAKAIEMLNNKEVEGRQISVNEARPREDTHGQRNSRSEGYRSYRGYGSGNRRERR